MFSKGQQLIWWDERADELEQLVIFERWGLPPRDPSEYPRALVRTATGEVWACAKHLHAANVPPPQGNNIVEACSECNTPERMLLCSLHFFGDVAPQPARADQDPRVSPRSTAALMCLLHYTDRLLHPAHRYWASVSGDARVLFDCGHRHRARADAIRCALTSGPDARVIHWGWRCSAGERLHEMNELSDALVALDLFVRATANPEDWGHLFDRWQEQRVTVVRDDAGDVSYRDGSRLGGQLHGDMENQRKEPDTQAGDARAQQAVEGDANPERAPT